ncbi:MAG TPA: hypothetical protein PKA30_15770, partial [Accumulibacter sp.]|uniref:hypothetical protein n=1 Tax=Accumulibacter sp. TaxID=2053492 RepID=UPI002BA8538A
MVSAVKPAKGGVFCHWERAAAPPLPSVQVLRLASCVLRRCVARLASGFSAIPLRSARRRSRVKRCRRAPYRWQ